VTDRKVEPPSEYEIRNTFDSDLPQIGFGEPPSSKGESRRGNVTSAEFNPLFDK